MAERSAIHKKKKTKNYTLLAMLLGMVALFFAVSVIRLSGH